MCRYAIYGPYKSHFACFACRKAFKQPPISDWLAVRGRGFAYAELSRLWSHIPSLERRELELGVRLSDLEAEYRDAAHRCPDCNEPMIDMGLDFKAPRQSDEKAWRNLLGMFRVGHVFHTCGCDGPGFIPNSTADYRQYLEERRKSYSSQMKRIQESTELSSAAKREACDYWVNRISLVDAELATLAYPPRNKAVNRTAAGLCAGRWCEPRARVVGRADEGPGPPAATEKQNLFGRANHAIC
jgi:hypothetical protein